MKEGNLTMMKCPLCGGSGEIPENLLAPNNFTFLKDLVNSMEIKPFLTWAEIRWRVEPDRSVTQVVHRELEIVKMDIQQSFDRIVKTRDEYHEKAFERFLEGFIEKANVKDEEKEKLEKEIREQWKKHMEQCTEDHKQFGEKLTQILENVSLTKRVPSRGFKFEKEAIEILEKEYPHWEFEPIPDSRIGDCIAKPKIKNGNGDFEQTQFSILIEFSDEEKTGTAKIRKLKENLMRRNIQFGVIITKRVDEIASKYRPFSVIDGNVAIAPMEFELYHTALRMFEGIIAILHCNKEEIEQVDWNQINSTISSVINEENEFRTFIVNKGQNLIQYSNRMNTEITNRLKEHWEKVVEKLKKEIMEANKEHYKNNIQRVL